MFEITAKDRHARCGRLSLAHGTVETPVFMPVGTQGTVKAISVDTLKKIGFNIILGNTYHLYLRPGTEILDKFGGLNEFMKWDRPILTDSGGLQEEAPSLGVPVLVLRQETERKEAIDAGTVDLIGTNQEKIVSKVEHLHSYFSYYKSMANAINPYGDGKSTHRILKIIEEKHFEIID